MQLLGFAVMPSHSGMETFQVILRWIHFLAGITWIGLLYFFNLVNVPFMKEIDAPTKGKVVPSLMPKALWWFRWSAVVTVLAGLVYWMQIVASDVRNPDVPGNWGTPMATFFGLWILVWVIEFVLIKNVGIPKGEVLAVIMGVLVAGAAWGFVALNDHGWESSRMISIGVGGGMGLVMLLNVWGIIWPNNKRTIAWTKDNATNGTPIPADSAKLARQAFLASRTNAWLSVPLLFFMAAASHYVMFGSK